MKRLITLLLLFCAVTIKAQQEPVASILFTDPVQAYKIQVSSNGGDSQTSLTEPAKDGLTYLHAIQYAYFKVDDDAILSTDHNLIIEITFFDEGNGNLGFQYNGTYNGATPTTPDNYKGLNIKKSNTQKWVTATVALMDASFRNAQNTQADFRITGGNYIREIKFHKGGLDPTKEPLVPVTASSYSEFKGKSVTGYQIWFATGDDKGGWVHWNGGTPPANGKVSFEVYPDVTEYDEEDLAQTDFANLGNGEPAKLFNSANAGVINTHFKWMKDYGIDGVAVQRFIGGIGRVILDSEDAYPLRVKKAAEETERIFYICYDISSNLEDTWTDVIKFDWVYNVEKTHKLTESSAYAKVGNKPVVQIWGPGFTSRPGTAQQTIELINFLKERGCYVIGGVPTAWRTEREDSKPNFMAAYNAFDMLSPWMVGRMSDKSGADSRYNNYMKPDKAHCDSKGIDYMPVLFPGFAWSQWNPGSPNEAPRSAGEFMWHQSVNIKKLGVDNMYFAMFDEYDEGTAIMKNATDWSMIPTDQYFLTSSADGYWLSSDFQLRVAGASIEMLKGKREVTTNVPVPHSEGPVYYRNSFEKRTTSYDYQTVDGKKVPQKTGTFNLDPCFFRQSQVSASGVSAQSTSIIESSLAKSGLYVAQITGNATGTTSSYYYKFAETKITVTKDMELRFSKYADNESGKYTSISLLFDNGSYLHNMNLADKDGINVNPRNARGTIGQWTDHVISIGAPELIGKTITSIILGYEGNKSGNFKAYFDNILISDGDIISGISPISTDNEIQVYATGQTVAINCSSDNRIQQVDILDMQGRIIDSKTKINQPYISFEISCPVPIAIINIQTDKGRKSMKVLIKNR